MKMLNSRKVNLTRNVPQHLRDDLVALVGAQDALHDGQDVVGRPGEDEDQQDGRQGLGRLPLLPLLLGGLLELVLPWQRTGGQDSGGLADTLHIPGHTDSQQLQTAGTKPSQDLWSNCSYFSRK